MIIIIRSDIVAQAEFINLHWGLIDTTYYKESKLNISIQHEKLKTNSIRFIKTNHKYKEALRELAKSHNYCWKRFIKAKSSTNQAKKLDFVNFCRNNCKHYMALINEVAPILYFDFNKYDEYCILDSILVENINYKEYKAGGGYVDKVGYYDIKLKHNEKKYIYSLIGKKRFMLDKAGQIVLRFRSDNLDSKTGYVYRGCYTINITFFFNMRNKVIPVQTGIFMMEV